MKKFYIFIVAISIGTGTNAQTVGFSESQCGIISNPSYHCHAYTIGSHGNGYDLYHNDSIIFTEGSLAGGSFPTQLNFFNDTVGFLFSWSVGGSIHIYKIVGNNVQFFGFYKSGGGDVYIINAYTIYVAVDLSLWPNFSNGVSIQRFSDLIPGKELIVDDSLISDISVFDTIKAKPLCDTLTQLNFKFMNNNDTLTYTIKLNVDDPTYYISENKQTDWKIFPNPTNDKITIENKQLAIESTLTILNENGQEILRKQIKNSKTQIDIRNLARGVYFVKLITDKTVEVRKIIKQ